jgi:hypothetical protein
MPARNSVGVHCSRERHPTGTIKNVDGSSQVEGREDQRLSYAGSARGDEGALHVSFGEVVLVG